MAASVFVLLAGVVQLQAADPATLAEASVEADLEAVRLTHDSEALAGTLQVARSELKALREGRAIGQILAPLEDEQQPLVEPLRLGVRQISDGLLAQRESASEATVAMTDQLASLRTQIYTRQAEMAQRKDMLEASLKRDLDEGVREIAWVSGGLSLLMLLTIVTWFWQPSRRFLRLGRWRYLALIVVAVAGVGAGAVWSVQTAAVLRLQQAREDWERLEPFAEQLAAAEQALAEKQAANERKQSRVAERRTIMEPELEAWQQAWAESDTWVAATGKDWQQLRAVMMPSYLDAMLQQELSQQLEDAKAQWTKVNNAAAPSLPPGSPFMWLAVVHGSAWGVLLLLAMAIPAYRRRVCLRCTSFGKLSSEKVDQVHVKRCTAKHAGERCGFFIAEELTHSPQFCFSVVGEVSAGKTIWLAAFHQTLDDGGVELPVDVRLSEETPGYQNLKDIIDVIRTRGPLQVRATEKDLPMPYLVHVEDHDWLRIGTATAGLGDFSGEDMGLSYTHPRKQRMLRSDGVIAILDLVSRADDSAQSSSQHVGLGRFSRELHTLNRQMKWLGPLLPLFGRVLDRLRRPPVAVCISKIETLGDHVSAGDVEQFHRKLEELEEKYSQEAGVVAGPRLIEARHRATKKLLEKINPGAIVAVRKITNRYKFFPMTSFGFNRPEGPGDLQPEMHLEPFFWLLHMCGYSPFRKRKRD